MPTVTYVGPLAGGRLHLPRIVDFAAGQPVDLTDDEAARLDDHWTTATDTGDGLDGLDRDALLAIVDEEDLAVSRRLGPARLAAAIRTARQSTTEETPNA